MCRLIESIKIKDGQLFHLDYHQQRMDRTCKELFNKTAPKLANLIKIPEVYKEGLVKCRILYTHNDHRVEFHTYERRTIRHLKLIHDNTIDYTYKYANRQHLENLFNKREDCDDILIVKNGLITDAFASNVVFFKNEIWYTPAFPLLKGTKRASLLNDKIITEKDISPDEIFEYKKISLINAMVDLEELIVEINSIKK